jgi:hypothetical protein
MTQMKCNKDVVKWLKTPLCPYDEVELDQQYSKNYKSYFGLTDMDGIYYRDGDIDDVLKGLFIENLQDDETTYDLNAMQFMDFLPVDCPQKNIDILCLNCTDREKHKISQIMRRRPIYILPGTIHSNANVLFKMIQSDLQHIAHNTPFMLPQISSDPRVRFENKYEDCSPLINKESLYNFAFGLSKR